MAFQALQNPQRYLPATLLILSLWLSACHHQDAETTSTTSVEPAQQSSETMKLALKAESGTIEPRGAGHYLIRLSGVMESSALILGSHTLSFTSEELFNNVASWSTNGDLATQLPALLTVYAEGVERAAGKNLYRLNVSRVMEYDAVIRSLLLDVVPQQSEETLDHLGAHANGDSTAFSSVDLQVALIPPPPVSDPFGDSGPSSELQCSMCKYLQQYMTGLPRPRTEEEVTRDLERSCSDIVPNPYKGTCAMVIEAAGAAILQELMTNPDNPVLCHQVRMCPQ